MSTLRRTTADEHPTIDDELRFGIDEDVYHSTLARILARQASGLSGTGRRQKLQQAHDTEANYHRIYPDARGDA